MNFSRLVLVSSLLPATLAAQIQYNPSGKTEYTDFENDTLQLERVVVTGQGGSRLKASHVTANTEIIGQQQLIRAACCNLGESFVTNPSVDVDYSDAATGARQIKLLGLSGTYVQMLTENVPTLRGAATPYALSFVPGPWMQSIQVSKGASSVKNGYESTTGQINIEYAKPQGTDGVRVNAYVDSRLKYEANLNASKHLTDRLSVGLLAHFDDFQQAHDQNMDRFVDMPKQRQWNVMPRIAYVAPRWISQLSVRALRDERESGQIGPHAEGLKSPYLVNVETERYEGQWKNGFPFGDDHNTSIALMLHGSWHDASNRFGARCYDVLQKNGYAQLMFETDLTERHNLSLGASVNHDYYSEHLREQQRQVYVNGKVELLETYDSWMKERKLETTAGLYAQYTYKLDEMLSVMAGIRGDYSDWYRYWFFTPRFHVKYTPSELFTLRASAGKGYRTAHALAENTSLLATGRQLCQAYNEEGGLKQEEAWNYGLSTSWNIPIGDENLELNAEYYYTNFSQQLVIDHVDDYYQMDHMKIGPSLLLFTNLEGKSYSHTLQVDASYPLFEGFSALAAFRYNDARTTYQGKLHRRPLTSQYKGLLTLSYKTPLEFWQFDLTGQLNGPGEFYDHETTYPSYFQLQAQITREFRLGSIYIGGENLTNYKLKNPIISALDPWNRQFDATQVWGPTDGIMLYVGFRLNLEQE